jgi:hypothetical protein
MHKEDSMTALLFLWRYRQVTGGVLLLLTLFLFIKHHDRQVRNEGIQIGIAQGAKDTEATLRPQWEAREAALLREQRAIEDDYERLKEETLKYTKRIVATRAATKATVEELDKQRAAVLETANATYHGEVINTTDSNLEKLFPNTPNFTSPEVLELAATEELLIARKEIEFLKDAQGALEELHDSQETAFEKRIVDLQSVNQNLNSRLTIMEQQRDFYKASFETVLPKKKGCGLFKKILTLGICK